MPWARFNKDFDFRATPNTQRIGYKKDKEYLLSAAAMEAASKVGAASEIEREEARKIKKEK